MLLMIPDFRETLGHRIQFAVPHPPQAVNCSLLSLCVLEEVTFYLLPCHPILCSSYQCSLLNFFFRSSSRLCNLIKCISCFLLVFSFKSTAGISGLKKGLPKRELICFFSVASGLIKDTPSFYRPQWKKSNLHL